MINNRKLHNVALSNKKGYNTCHLRKEAIAWSNNYLLLPNNEKLFNFERIKEVNRFNSDIKKDDYNGLHLKRHGESDRMKKERHYGKKVLRRYLKREALDLIEQEQ